MSREKEIEELSKRLAEIRSKMSDIFVRDRDESKKSFFAAYKGADYRKMWTSLRSYALANPSASEDGEISKEDAEENTVTKIDCILTLLLGQWPQKPAPARARYAWVGGSMRSMQRHHLRCHYRAFYAPCMLKPAVPGSM
jgi:hypothetical protein